MIIQWISSDRLWSTVDEFWQCCRLFPQGWYDPDWGTIWICASRLESPWKPPSCRAWTVNFNTSRSFSFQTKRSAIAMRFLNRGRRRQIVLEKMDFCEVRVKARVAHIWSCLEAGVVGKCITCHNFFDSLSHAFQGSQMVLPLVLKCIGVIVRAPVPLNNAFLTTYKQHKDFYISFLFFYRLQNTVGILNWVFMLQYKWGINILCMIVWSCLSFFKSLWAYASADAECYFKIFWLFPVLLLLRV